MKQQLSIVIFIVGMFCCVLLVGCGPTKPLTAENSLKGKWLVTEVISNEVDGNSTREPGGSGIFNFGEAVVDYSFSRKGQTYQGKENWRLEATKENAGFVKVDRFYLYTKHQDYQIEFGDQTQNSEKNATRMAFVSREKLANGGAAYRIVLRK